MLLFGSFAGGQLETNRGNVCKHYIDYSTRADCLYNPDLDSTTVRFHEIKNKEIIDNF